MPQQHRGGDRPEGKAAFGHTADDVLYIGHVHIPAQGPGFIRADPDIHENRPVCDMAAADQMGLAGRGNQQIGPAADVREIPGPRMAHGHGGVPGQEEQGKGLAHDWAATDHGGVYARKLHSSGS